MDFDFMGSIYVDDSLLREMYLLCKKKGHTVEQAYRIITADLDYITCHDWEWVQEDIMAEIRRRLRQSEK